MHSAYRTTIVALSFMALFLITACGAPVAEGPQFDAIPVVVPDPALARQVPADVRADGMLTIATDPTFPPMEFMDDGRIRGADIDLGRAIAQTLELTPSFQSAQFSNIVPLVAVDTYELGMSALWADNPTASFSNMVTYLKAGVQLAGRAGTAAPVNATLAVCGHSVAVEEGTEFIDTMVKISAACVRQGRQPIDIRATDDQDSATALLTSGAVDAMLADSPVVTYAVDNSAGELVTLTGPIDVRPYGIAVSPTHQTFGAVVRMAVQRLIDSGVYQRIMQTWGLESNQISEPELLIGKHSELLEMSSATPPR